eukprot:SAG31_NODE_4882_length_2886_cov_9.714029_2_plen_118_part_00
MPKADAHFSQRAAELEKRGKEENSAAEVEHLASAAAVQGAVQTESGLVYLETVRGTGSAPTASDSVKVHYEGKLLNGQVFDSSYSRGEPITFPLGKGCYFLGFVPTIRETRDFHREM